MVRVVVWIRQEELREHLCRELKQTLGRAASVIPVEDAEGFRNAAGERGMKKYPGILIVDIDGDGGCGIDLAGQVQETCGNMKVIFLAQSAFSVTEIFRANPSNFFLKPVNTGRLVTAVGKLIGQLEQEDRNYFVVTFKGCVFQVKTMDILYFESQKRTVVLHCREEKWVVYRKLDDIQDEMPEYFVRCHQSYLVNMHAITGIKAFKLELDQGKQLPVSRPRYRETKSVYLDFLGVNIAI